FGDCWKTRNTGAKGDLRLPILDCGFEKSAIRDRQSAIKCVAMNGEPLRRTFTISNPQGLHMRPITAFVETANKFKSDVFLEKEGADKINGKSPLGLLGLAA